MTERVNRDDRAELLASLPLDISRAVGSERTRFTAQLAVTEAMRPDEELEDYQEAGERLGLTGLVTSGDVVSLGIVRLAKPARTRLSKVEETER